MALRAITGLINAGKNANNLLRTRCHVAGSGVLSIQKANLTAIGGTSEHKVVSRFGFVGEVIDTNSKVIVVEGNIATGKTELAKAVAKEFDMKYFSDVTEDEMFWLEEYNCDIRLANERLPDGHKIVDLETFYTSPNPEKTGFGRTQCSYLVQKIDTYLEAQYHLLSTGQGVVIEKSPFSDFVYADVLRRNGFMSKKMAAFYKNLNDKSMERIWKPHAIIYLGAPVSYIREQIKKRALPYEVGCKILTDDYIKSLDYLYREEFLQKRMKPFCEILVYEAHNLPDIDEIVWDLEKMNLDPPIITEPFKFYQWENPSKSTLNVYRTFCKARRHMCGKGAAKGLLIPDSPEYELDALYLKYGLDYLKNLRRRNAW